MKNFVQTDQSVRDSLERVSYSMAEAAEACGVGLSLLEQAVKAGRLRTFRWGRRRLVTKADLQKFVFGLRDSEDLQ